MPPTDTPATPSPSLRRVLAAYLRLRSPYNLCLDAALITFVSYVLSSIRRWLYMSLTPEPRPDQFSMMWAAKEVVDIATGMVYYIGFGLFLLALARLIADRIGADSHHH